MIIISLHTYAQKHNKVKCRFTFSPFSWLPLLPSATASFCLLSTFVLISFGSQLAAATARDESRNYMELRTKAATFTCFVSTLPFVHSASPIKSFIPTCCCCLLYFFRFVSDVVAWNFHFSRCLMNVMKSRPALFNWTERKLFDSFLFNF